jgi:hypothetical protein
MSLSTDLVSGWALGAAPRLQLQQRRLQCFLRLLARSDVTHDGRVVFLALDLHM